MAKARKNSGMMTTRGRDEMKNRMLPEQRLNRFPEGSRFMGQRGGLREGEVIGNYAPRKRAKSMPKEIGIGRAIQGGPRRKSRMPKGY